MMTEAANQQSQQKTPPPAHKAKTKEEGTPLTDEAVEQEGDIEAGKYSPEELAEQVAPRAIPIRDRRAYLIDQARRNEAVNDEVNAREVEVINNGRTAFGLINDPDRMREESFESSVAEIEMHTPEGAKKLMQSRDAIKAAREKEGNPTPVPGGAKHRASLEHLKDNKDKKVV